METILSSLDTPSLIVDTPVMENNLRRMAEFADDHGVTLRPHTKTHKCPALAKKQIELGAVGCAVAKLSEAEVMANAGIKDIKIANEVVGVEKIKRLVPLSKRCKLTIAVDNRENASMISKIMDENDASVNVLIDVDIGFNRCGIIYTDSQRIIRFIKFLIKKPGIDWKGIMTHAGQVYKHTDQWEIRKIGLNEGRQMVKLARDIRRQKLDCQTISVGSTPTAKYAGAVDGVTEIRPGNYIFHDFIQVSMGVAKISDCALRVLATVMSTPTRSRVIIDAGSKVLGPELGAHGNSNIKGHGLILGKKAEIYTYSEEHGFVGRFNKDGSFKLGERIQIVPNHACYVVNLFDKFTGVPDGIEYEVEGRGASQ